MLDPHAGENVLIGRENELAEFANAAARVRDGQGALILVSGEAGIGKTSLVSQAIANAGFLPLTGRAHLGVPVPYGPLVTAMRTDPDVQSEIVLPTTDRADLFEALRSWLSTMARQRPIALFLDDLHWADHATLELLPALASALDRSPLLIVGAYRSDELPRTHPIRRLRAELRRSGQLREVMIEPLDQMQTSRLAARVLGSDLSPTLAAALYDRTEGVPFFVQELAVALADGHRLHQEPSGLSLAPDDALPLPESVRDVVSLQVEGISVQARRVLDIAAVAGQEIDLDLLTTLAGDDEPGLTPLLDRALLVESGPSQVAFRHALTREACYLDVPWPRRRAIHRDIATLLEASGGPPLAIAEHWLGAREHEGARRALVAAGELSCEVHAYRDATTAFRRALEIWPEQTDEPARHDLLDRLGACFELAGDLSEAIRVWREAVDARRLAGETEAVAKTERRLAGVYELRGDWERALAAREAAAAAFSSIDQPAEAATERLLAAGYHRSAATFHAALALVDIARGEVARTGRVDLEVRLQGLEGNLRVRLGDSASGMEMVRAALATALQQNLPGPAAEVYQRLADALEHAGDYTGAQETYTRAFDYCRMHDADTMATLCMACLSVVLRQTGEWSRATTVCRDVLASPGIPVHARTVASGTLGAIFALRGDVRSARPLLLQAASLARHIELAAMEILAAWGLALIDDINDAPEAVLAHCRDVLRRWERTEERHYVIPVLRWSTTFCAEHGADHEVRACAAALGTIAAHTGHPEALAALAHALGETALLDGDAEQAVNQFTYSLDLLRDQELPLDQVHTERRLGNALVRAGEREVGVARLTAAHRGARKLGARPLATRIAQDLQLIDAPIERHLGRTAANQHSNAGLSRREMDVLRQIAVGRTTREIGQLLFISPRTVEMHVQGILAKLDCRTRAEATRKAAELGLLVSASERIEFQAHATSEADS